jgi:hypothetical protein
MTLEGFGRKAYQDYGDYVGWQNFAGLPMPQWEELPETIRQAWLVSVRGTIGQVFAELEHQVFKMRGEP